MLSKKDLQKIEDLFRVIIKEEIALSHTRTLLMECGPKKQGDPDGKVTKEVKVNMLDFWTKYAPRIEGALRGMQRDVTRTVNRVNKQGDQVNALGQVLLGLEAPVKAIAKLSDFIQSHTAIGNKDENHNQIGNKDDESDPEK